MIWFHSSFIITVNGYRFPVNQFVYAIFGMSTIRTNKWFDLIIICVCLVVGPYKPISWAVTMIKKRCYSFLYHSLSQTNNNVSWFIIQYALAHTRTLTRMARQNQCIFNNIKAINALFLHCCFIICFIRCMCPAKWAERPYMHYGTRKKMAVKIRFLPEELRTRENKINVATKSVQSRKLFHLIGRIVLVRFHFYVFINIA